MKTICLYFQVHQPFRFRRYRFFDIGNNHYYYDDYTNESTVAKIAQKCYLPANEILLKLLKSNKGKFKVTFSLSGIAMKQFQLYVPEVLESFKKLADTGQVEFLSETYCHSLVALKDRKEFERQVKKHDAMIKEFFGQEPKVFRNTELIYSDEMGDMVYDMGYKAMLTEGAKHVLGWKSPNYLYCNSMNPKLKVLLKNFVLSDDIAFRFGNKGWSEWPLTPQKYTQWLKDLEPKSEVINLFMDYETFGEHQWKETGIFEFLENWPNEVLKNQEFSFSTPSEVVDSLQPVSAINVPYPISWADEERDLTAWLGNEMQEEAFNKLYALLPKIEKCNDHKLCDDWEYLQASDHFYYMCTKYFSDGDVHAYFNPYESPYQAFINYMNVLSDFTLRLNAAIPENSLDESVSQLTHILKEKEELIAKLQADVKKMRNKKKKEKSKVS
jgi:alpha-amylase